MDSRGPLLHHRGFLGLCSCAIPNLQWWNRGIRYSCETLRRSKVESSDPRTDTFRKRYGLASCRIRDERPDALGKNRLGVAGIFNPSWVSGRAPRVPSTECRLSKSPSSRTVLVARQVYGDVASRVHFGKGMQERLDLYDLMYKGMLNVPSQSKHRDHA